MIVHVFDVDGTITHPRQPMDEEFAKFFLSMRDVIREYCLVSGSDFGKLQEQVPEQILKEAEFVFACNGNDVWKFDDNDGWENLDSEPVFNDENIINFLKTNLNYFNYSGPKYEPHFEFRKGLLNFSIIGRGASKEERDEYEKWDSQDGERLRLVNDINEKFPKYHATIGGQISIDITEKGKDKSLVYYYLRNTDYYVHHDIYFYGDKIDNGNDAPLANIIRKTSTGKVYGIVSPEDFINNTFIL